MVDPLHALVFAVQSDAPPVPATPVVVAAPPVAVLVSPAAPAPCSAERCSGTVSGCNSTDGHAAVRHCATPIPAGAPAMDAPPTSASLPPAAAIAPASPTDPLSAAPLDPVAPLRLWLPAKDWAQPPMPLRPTLAFPSLSAALVLVIEEQPGAKSKTRTQRAVAQVRDVLLISAKRSMRP